MTLKSITRQPKLSKKAMDELAKYKLDLKAGDTVIGLRDGGEYKIQKISSKGIDLLHRWWDEETGQYQWSHYGTMDFKDFGERYTKLDKPYEQIEREALTALANLDNFEDTPVPESACTDIVRAGSQDAIQQAIGMVESKRREMMIIQAILNQKRDHLNHLVTIQNERLKKMRRVLTTIELYLGIYEDIVVLREGEPAPVETPVSIRQQLLYMDEEIAVFEEGGLDAMDLEKFDQWLLDPKHLDRILPETKGIVALRVRRGEKKYGDIWTQMQMDQENARTYFLIRNGEQLFRIWAGLIIHPRLFPLKNEFTQYFRDPDSLDYFKEKDLEEKEFTYKQAIVVLQGLIDRTEVFNPLGNGRINLLDPTTWDGRVNLIHDDELSLPSGRLPFQTWKKEISSKIQVGSHIVYGGRDFAYQSDDHKYHSRFLHVSPPVRGVYQVMGLKAGPQSYGREMWYFLYNPQDTIWSRDIYTPSHERKNRISWFFDADESNILNYDQISLDDIEYYLNSRTDRPHYLHMMPLLITLKKQREEEVRRESLFVGLVAHRIHVSADKVWEAVDWWKHKNKWKRPLDQDDAKALRMIEKRLLINEGVK